MMLVRFLMLKDRTSEEVASEKLNSAKESFENFIEGGGQGFLVTGDLGLFWLVKW